jgi:hypothetical protein
MICSFEYRFDEVQALRVAVIRKPSDRGFLTRSDGGPRRAGRWRVLDRLGDFSPGLSRPPIPRRLGFVSTKENLPRTVAKSPLKATGERFPLDHP